MYLHSCPECKRMLMSICPSRSLEVGRRNGSRRIRRLDSRAPPQQQPRRRLILTLRYPSSNAVRPTESYASTAGPYSTSSTLPPRAHSVPLTSAASILLIRRVDHRPPTPTAAATPPRARLTPPRAVPSLRVRSSCLSYHLVLSVLLLPLLNQRLQRPIVQESVLRKSDYILCTGTKKVVWLERSRKDSNLT